MTRKEELISDVVAALPPDADGSIEVVRAVVEAFATIREPEMSMNMELSILNKDWEKGAINRKPGNAFLDWKKLSVSTAAITSAVAAATAKPWLIPVAAALVWREVRGLTSVEVDKRDAVALSVMWENCDSDHNIDSDKALDLVSKQFREYELGAVDKARFERILKTLEKLRCIEVADGNIWLREWCKREI